MHSCRSVKLTRDMSCAAGDSLYSQRALQARCIIQALALWSARCFLCTWAFDLALCAGRSGSEVQYNRYASVLKRAKDWGRHAAWRADGWRCGCSTGKGSAPAGGGRPA
jgi:hypothetical protein